MSQNVPVNFSPDITIDCTWWNAVEKERKPHELLAGVLETLRRRQSTLFENTKKCISIFQWGGDAKNVDNVDDPVLEETCLAFNAAQNLVETVQSKVCKTRILPMALTSGGGPHGGGYMARHRAKQLSRGIEGEFDENDVDSIVEDVVMDSLATAHGGGAAKVFEHRGRVRIEHVPIEDIWFDDAEIRYRRPRSCYHVQRIDKYVLLSEYGCDDDDLFGEVDERRRAIVKAGAGSHATSRGRDGSQDQIEVYEAWHLPSGDVEYDLELDDEGNETGKTPRHDGRHVIAIDGCTLLDEPWDNDFFPFQLYIPRKRRRSIWGLSLMFDLVAPQREYEKLTGKIQAWNQKAGLSGLSAPRGANVDARELTAGTLGAGFLVEHDGPQGPIPLVTDPVPTSTYAYKDSIPREMSERKGISTLATSSQLPAGMQQASGKALQVFEDFESERLMPYHRELERFIVGLAWLVVHTARRIVDREGDYKVRYRGKRMLEPIAWADILVDAEDMVLKVFPVSALSRQPSARFAQLQELLNNQAITVEQFKRLYELPDLEAESELDTADTDIIDRNLDIMITTGRYLAPQPFDALDVAVTRAGKFWNLCRQYEVPEPRLKLVSDYIEDAKGLIDTAKAKALAKQQADAMAAGPPPGAPPPVGGPPPMNQQQAPPQPAPDMPMRRAA